MRVAITGSSGMVGTALRESLAADGHEVVRLVRRPVQAHDEVMWDPAIGRLDPTALEGVEAAVNLAGAGLGELILPRSMVYLALSYDHRLVDGADAARFLTTVKERLEGGNFEVELGLG